MLFSSLEFLCFFFPVFFLVYFLVSRLCKKAVWPRNAVLLVFSLVFYAWGELSYFWLLMLSIGINYVFALLIGRCKPGPNTKGSRAGAKALLAGDVAVNLALLGVFKYAGLAVTTLNTICGTAFTVPENRASHWYQLFYLPNHELRYRCLPGQGGAAKEHFYRGGLSVRVSAAHRRPYRPLFGH